MPIVSVVAFHQFGAGERGNTYLKRKRIKQRKFEVSLWFVYGIFYVHTSCELEA